EVSVHGSKLGSMRKYALLREDGLVLFEVLQNRPGAANYGGQGIIRNIHRKFDTILEQRVQAFEQCPAAGKHYPALQDVRTQFRGSSLQATDDRSGNLPDRFAECFAHVFRRDGPDFRDAAHQVTALDGYLELGVEFNGAADLAFDPLGRS